MTAQNRRSILRIVQDGDTEDPQVADLLEDLDGPDYDFLLPHIRQALREALLADLIRAGSDEVEQ